MYAKAIKILRALKREYLLQEHKITRKSYEKQIKLTDKEKRKAKNFRMKYRAMIEAIYRLEYTTEGKKR